MSTFAELTEHIAATQTVTIITTRESGEEIATPIWAVTVDDVSYVRSAFAEKAAWNRRARSGRPVAFTLADGSNAERDPSAALGDPRVPVTIVRIPFDADEQASVDAAYRAKYGHLPDDLATVLTDDARELTLKVLSA